MTTQNIHRTAHQTNFSVRSNVLLQDNTLSNEAYRLINHLLSLPPDWTIYPKQIMRYFQWSKDRVYKALKELRTRGYATLKRCRRSSIWTIYETPLTGQTDATPCAEIVDEPNDNAPSKIPSIKNSYHADTLQSNKISLTKKEKNTTTAVEPAPESRGPKKESVVVSLEEINPTVVNHAIQQKTLEALPVGAPQPTTTVLPVCNSAISDNRANPEIIEAVERLPVTATVKPSLVKTLAALTLVEAKMVLMILTRAISLGTVKNPVGYTVQLVRAAQNGTLSPVVAQQQETIAQRIAREEKARQEEAKRGVMSNDEWARGMIDKLGLESFLKIAPWYRPNPQ